MVTPTLRQITTERASDVQSAHEEQLITAATIFDHAASSRGLACCGYCRTQVAALMSVQELRRVRACSFSRWSHILQVADAP